MPTLSFIKWKESDWTDSFPLCNGKSRHMIFVKQIEAMATQTLENNGGVEAH